MSTLYDMIDDLDAPTDPLTPYTPAALARLKHCNERTVRRAIVRGELLGRNAAHGRGRPVWIVLWQDAEGWTPRPEGWKRGKARKAE